MLTSRSASMPSFLLVGLVLTSGWGLVQQLSAQTVASQYPAGSSYVVSSSPTSDGGVITTVYQAPTQTTSASTLGQPQVETRYRPLTLDEARSLEAAQRFPANTGSGNRSLTAPIQQAAYSSQASYPTSDVPTHGSRPLAPQTAYRPQTTTAPQTLSLPNGSTTGSPAPSSAITSAPPASLPPQLAPNTGSWQPQGTGVSPPPAQSLPSTVAPLTSTPAPATYNSLGVNPYVGFPLPSQQVGRVSYTPAQGTQCAPAAQPPSLSNLGSPYGPQTVPVTQQMRPLLPIRGLPAGTYVSQGIWGTPRAYVDGQPVRNVFRYLVP